MNQLDFSAVAFPAGLVDSKQDSKRPDQSMHNAKDAQTQAACEWQLIVFALADFNRRLKHVSRHTNRSPSYVSSIRRRDCFGVDRDCCPSISRFLEHSLRQKMTRMTSERSVVARL